MRARACVNMGVRQHDSTQLDPTYQFCPGFPLERRAGSPSKACVLVYLMCDSTRSWSLASTKKEVILTMATPIDTFKSAAAFIVDVVGTPRPASMGRFKAVCIKMNSEV